MTSRFERFRHRGEETFLPFEKPIREIIRRIRGLEQDLSSARSELRETIEGQIKNAKGELAERWEEDVVPQIGHWETVLLSRQPERPTSLDLIHVISPDFVELHGDRRFGDDPAVVGGLATVGERAVMIIGTQRGKDTKENVERHFGSPRAEGYRKAQRLMAHAEKFGLPVITIIDTPGADPSAESEERGIAQAIAESIQTMSQLKVPIISVITGQGGSGGALALAIGDQLLAFQFSWFSVISPEGAASILWRDDPEGPKKAAEAFKLAGWHLPNLLPFAEVIPEPPGGAHRFPKETAEALKMASIGKLGALEKIPLDRLVEERNQKFRQIGRFVKNREDLLKPG